MNYLEIARRVMREHAERRAVAESLESVLQGRAIGLGWSGEALWLVVDEADAARLGEPRGTVYTVAEARLICAISDPAVVAEVHEWKRQFNAKLRNMTGG